MSGDSLEAMLDDTESSGSPRNVEGLSISELISELDKALNSTFFYAKSNITKRNLRGIMKAESFQKYLFNRFGFRIDTLDTLVTTKIENVLSVDGKGRKDITDIIQKGTVKVEAKSGLDVFDRLLGGSPR